MGDFSFLAGLGAFTIGVALFLSMTLCYLLGIRVSSWRKSTSNFGVIESSVFGLLALLLAFTFGFAASRYDDRRQILVAEANDIGTAILRSDLYAEDERKGFREDFKQYVEARIAFYEAGSDDAKVKEALKIGTEIQGRIWGRAARLSQEPRYFISTNQMVPALNDMIDIVTTRNASNVATVPDTVVWMLFVLCSVSSFTVGFGKGEQKPWWVGVFVFIFTVCLAVALIIDIDRPRGGSITLDAMNQTIVGLRSMFANDQ